jgi:hypothetical protein
VLARRTLPVALLLSLACAGAPPADPVVENTHRSLTVTAEGILPDADVRIPLLGSIAWLNARVDGQPIVVRLRGARQVLEQSLRCRTLSGFEFGSGADVRAQVEAGDFASTCFHVPGRYHYAVSSGGTILSGSVVVSGEEGP